MPPDQCERTNSMTPKIVRPISRSVSRRQSIKDDDAASVEPDAMIKALAADNRTLLGQLKETKAAAESDGDIATSGLVDGWADETEQRIWFLEATLGY